MAHLYELIGVLHRTVWWYIVLCVSQNLKIIAEEIYTGIKEPRFPRLVL